MHAQKPIGIVWSFIGIRSAAAQSYVRTTENDIPAEAVVRNKVAVPRKQYQVLQNGKKSDQNSSIPLPIQFCRQTPHYLEEVEQSSIVQEIFWSKGSFSPLSQVTS